MKSNCKLENLLLKTKARILERLLSSNLNNQLII